MMKSWLAIGALIFMPIVFLTAVGAIWLAERSWLLPAVGLLILSWGAAGIVLQKWTRRVTTPEAPKAWTARDRDAWKLIEDHELGLADLEVEELSNRETQEKIAADLALKIARHYHPEARDPLGPLTLPEVLAAAKHAIADAARWADYYVPGSRLLTCDQWRRLGRVPSRLMFLGTLIAGGTRWLKPRGSQAGPAGPVIDAVGKSAEAATSAQLHRFLLRKLGYYLIELYSGRFRRSAPKARQRADLQPERRTLDEVTIAIVGKRGAGKASLVRGLLGYDHATSDRLPAAKHVRRHRVQLSQPLARLVVLVADIMKGCSSAELSWITQHSQLAVLVCDATRPVDETHNQVDVLSEACPAIPLIALLTHVDQLLETPLGEAGSEEEMWRAIEPWREQLETRVAAIVPTCTEPTNAFGISEWFVPVVTAELSEAQAFLFSQAVINAEATGAPG